MPKRKSHSVSKKLVVVARVQKGDSQANLYWCYPVYKPSYKCQGRFRPISISTHKIYWLKQSFSKRNIHGSNLINSVTAQQQRYTCRDGATCSETLTFILSLTHSGLHSLVTTLVAGGGPSLRYTGARV